MAAPLPSLIDPPIGFAHRGARAHERDNTIAAFKLALRLGATGLETDAWLTRDGHVVLDHDGFTWSRLRRWRIASVERSALRSHIASLDELYSACGSAFELSIDVMDPRVAAEAVRIARDASDGTAARLWLCHPDVDLLSEWRELDADVKLVNSTRLAQMKEGPERRAATLAERGVDAVNLPQSEWSAGLTTLFHRFGLFALGWDAQHRRVIASLLGMGIDGIFSDHVDLLMETIREDPSGWSARP